MKPKILPNDEHHLDTTPSKFCVVTEPNIRLTNVCERLGAFYSWHVDSDGCLIPAARILNPEYNGQRINPRDDVWLYPFYKGFRVSVLKHHLYITGPHAARLYYKSHQLPYLYWIATLQISDVMFYNEPVMLERLQEAIIRREFYISPASRKDVVAL